MYKTLFIINPKSGKNNSKKDLLNVFELLSNNDFDLKIYFTRGQKDAYEYTLKNGRFFDVILVSGGDGTINEVTSALIKLKNKPKLGYFPSGTMNDFGSNFDLGDNYLDIANKIIKMKTKEFDLCEFNNQYFNYVAGFGSLTDVSYKTKREAKETLGSIAYILEGLNSLQYIKPTKTTFKINNKKEETMNVLFGLIFSGNRVAGMSLFNKKDAISDGNINILLVEYTDNLLEYGNYLALLAQKENKYLHWYKASEIELEFEEDVEWTLDGEEVDGKKKANILIHNKVLEMIC